MAAELAALDKGESARASERSGGVSRAAPNGFELDVAHPGEEELRLLQLWLPDFYDSGGLVGWGPSQTYTLERSGSATPALQP